jgi:hypothetical protein
VYKRYARIKISTNVKKALDDLNPLGKSYSQVIVDLAKKARLLGEEVVVDHGIKSHKEAARIAMEKASSIDGVFLEIMNRSLIKVATYDYRSSYHTARGGKIEGDILEFDHSRQKTNLENETRLYLVQGSPNRGVIEVIKFNSTLWRVSYLGIGTFKITVWAREKRIKKRKSSSNNKTSRFVA